MYDTSYDGTAGYMVKNPINRYLINSTSENLVLDDDGGLTITIQRREPTDLKERANWLPTPEGRFYLALRLYWPQPALSTEHGNRHQSHESVDRPSVRSYAKAANNEASWCQVNVRGTFQ
jgi:hypothetical protein